jgi:hypothetical protein
MHAQLREGTTDTGVGNRIERGSRFRDNFNQTFGPASVVHSAELAVLRDAR